MATRAYFGEFQDFQNPDIEENTLMKNKSLALQKFKFGDELRTSSPNYEYKKLFDIDKMPNGGYLDENPSIDADLLCNLYSLELCPSLNLSPNSLPLLVGEPNNNTQKFREGILQLVESIGIPKIFISKKGLLHAYSQGLSNAMIFESGAVSSSLIIVEDGYVQ